MKYLINLITSSPAIIKKFVIQPYESQMIFCPSVIKDIDLELCTDEFVFMEIQTVDKIPKTAVNVKNIE